MVNASGRKKKICVVTGTRADYGLLLTLLTKLREHPSFDLSLLVTGAHLCHDFGLTYREIERAGFVIADQVEMLLASDTEVGIAKSVGLATIGFADSFRRLKPDLVLVTGDRFEMLAAAQAALFAKLPMAHIFGGDLTAGAFDEAIRHSITKMAHLHFVTNVQSAKVVRQLGEQAEAIFNVGSPSLDSLLAVRLWPRSSLEADLGFTFRAQNLLVTFHPETLQRARPAQQFEAVLAALSRFAGDCGIIFTLPNADTHNRELREQIEAFCARYPNAKAFASLGHERYISVMAQVDAVVGNSSSGLYEAPSLKVATVNIGARQAGRLCADSVISCAAESGPITEAITKAITMDCSQVINPYGDGKSADRIIEVLEQYDFEGQALSKKFALMPLQ